MKYLAYIATVAILATGLLTACEDSSTVGSSLIDNNIEIVVDSTYTVTGHSVANPEVRSRTIVQILGRINVEGYGNLSSDVVTQFISAEMIDVENIKIENIDSVKLVLGMPHGSFVGDSIVPMGIEVYPLTKALDVPIYSNFDPKGYYDPNDCWGSTIYAATVNNLTNSSEIDEDYRLINVTLPLEFGRRLYNQYKDSPATFATPQAFTKWFPGLYIRNSFGSGRLVNIASTSIKLYYHNVEPVTGTDRDTTIQHIGTYMAVSPEVITNNNLNYTMSPQLQERAAKGEAVIAAPIGYDVEFRFPGREIVADFRNAGTPMAVVNSLTFEVPAKAISNSYDLAAPTYLLMVKKSKKDDFFSKSQLPDNVNSFYATYNSSKGVYEFTGMGNYLDNLLDKEEITDEDVDFVFTPVTATFVKQNSSSIYDYYYGYGSSSNTTLESIIPYVLTPVMCTLDLPNAKIKFTYSKQRI